MPSQSKKEYVKHWNYPCHEIVTKIDLTNFWYDLLDVDIENVNVDEKRDYTNYRQQ